MITEIIAEKNGYETVIRIVNKDLLIDGVIRELDLHEGYRSQ